MRKIAHIASSSSVDFEKTTNKWFEKNSNKIVHSVNYSSAMSNQTIYYSVLIFYSDQNGEA